MTKKLSKDQQKKAINWAIKENDFEELKAILDMMPVDTRFEENHLTLLMLLIIKKQYVFFQELLLLIGKYDFNLDEKDKNGLTVADYALISEDEKTINALLNAFWFRIITTPPSQSIETYEKWINLFARTHKIPDYLELEQKKEQLQDILTNKQWLKAEDFIKENHLLMTQPYYPGRSPGSK